jgi:hypothetical protein
MLQTFWLEGYKIAARSKSQALLSLDALKRAGVPPDYASPSYRFSACYSNHQGCA